jgi:hypothetical protein
MLSKGDVGPAVKYLQAALNIHMFDCPEPLVVDGKFGPLTEARTALFQGRNDLLVDAVVGPLTTGALCTYAVSEQHLILAHSPTRRRGPYDVDRPRPIKPIPVSPRPYPFTTSPPETPDARFKKRYFKGFHIGFEGGLETRFSYDVSERRSETKSFALTNVTGFWSRSIHKHVALGLGIGYLFERPLQRKREYESKAFLFSRLQLKTFTESGRFGLPVNFETQWVDPVGKHKAFCATLAIGPEISFFDERLVIGLGGIGTVCAEGRKVTVTGSLGAKASLLFGDKEDKKER